MLHIAPGSESKEKWEEEEMNNFNLQQCDSTKECLIVLIYSPKPPPKDHSQVCLSVERRGKSRLINSEPVAGIQCGQTTKPLFCDAFQGHTSWPWEGIWGDSPSCQKGFLPKNSILSQEVKPAVFFNLDPKSSVCLVLGVQMDHQRGSHCLKQKPVLTG